METLSAQFDTSFTSVPYRDALKTKIQWNTFTPPLPSYNSTSGNLTVTIPAGNVIVLDETLVNYKIVPLQANGTLALNTVANNAYTNQVELESSSNPFRRVDSKYGGILVDSITDPALVKSATYNFYPEDYLRSMAVETGFKAPRNVKKYFVGGSITNEDVVGKSNLLEISGDDPDVDAAVVANIAEIADAATATITAGINTTKTNIITALNAKLTTISEQLVNARVNYGPQNEYVGVNNFLGLNLEVNATNATGVRVGGMNADESLQNATYKGNCYRLDNSGLFKENKLFLLMKPLELTFYLDNAQSVFFNADEAGTGAGAVPVTDYRISDFRLHVKMLQLPSSVVEQMKKKLEDFENPNPEISALGQQAVYQYETYRVLTQQLNPQESNLSIKHYNMGLKNVKAVFCVFRRADHVTNLLIPDKKSCFIFPSYQNDGTTPNQDAGAYVQWVLNGTSYPEDSIECGPKNWVRVANMCSDAFTALDNYNGGTKLPIASWNQRGNFMLGLRLRANELAASRDLDSLEIKFNMTPSKTNANIISQVIVIYDTRLVLSATKVSVDPQLIPSIVTG